MTTVRQIITDSLRLIEEVGAGETPSAESSSDAMRALSMMINSWSPQGDLIYSETVETFNLTANDGVYTIGATGDFATPRPTRIVAATVNDGSIDKSLDIIPANIYAAIQDKTIVGVPDTLTFFSDYPNATIKLYPLPSSAYTITLYTEKPLTEYTSLDTVLSLPPGYERALKYNLAIEIAPEYGKQASATVMKIAIESKNAIRNANNRYDNDKLMTDAALISKSGYNIYSE
jgi:hypothetical protein